MIFAHVLQGHSTSIQIAGISITKEKNFMLRKMANGFGMAKENHYLHTMKNVALATGVEGLE